MTADFTPIQPTLNDAERCHSLVNAARWPVLFAEAAKLRTLWDPWACPVDQLPLLAWAWSVDFWKAEWPEHRKRQVIAESRAYHEAKTTVLGYRMALGYVDAEFVRARLPRHAFFAGAAPTQESHDRWLAGLPEIRIYTAVFPIKRRPVRFLQADGTIVQRTLKGRFVGRRFRAHSAKSIVLDGRRPELRRPDGSVQRLVFEGVRIDSFGRLLSDPERLVIPAPLRSTFQVGKRLRGRFVGDGKANGTRVISLSFSTGVDVFRPNAVSPGLTAIDVVPRQMWDVMPPGRGWFISRARKGRGIQRNRADELAYLSIRLADGSRPEYGGRMRNRIGRTRVRRAPFTATVLAHLSGPPKHGFPVGRFVKVGPEARIAEAINALAVTQAARDTVYLDINSVRPITYGDLARLPENVRAGAIIRI